MIGLLQYVLREWIRFIIVDNSYSKIDYDCDYPYHNADCYSLFWFFFLLLLLLLVLLLRVLCDFGSTLLLEVQHHTHAPRSEFSGFTCKVWQARV